MTYQKQRRVVIIGLGVVAANGIGKEDFWEACISGRSGVGHNYCAIGVPVWYDSSNNQL
jgi:hypothetical protein